MEDELWSTDRQGDRLRNLRSDGRQVWSDSAAREVTVRWLDPHDDLARAVVRSAQEQHVALEVARVEQREADAQALVAASRAADTVGWLHQLDDAAARARSAAAEADHASDRATHSALAADAAASRAQTMLALAR